MSICKPLRLDQPGTQRALLHPLLAGRKVIGRGAFSLVFEGTKKNTVLKLTVDSCNYFMLNCWAYRVEHRHFPRVVERHGDIDVVRINGHDYPLFLFEIEKLQHLERGTDSYRLARLLRQSANTASSGVLWKMEEDVRATVTLGSMMKDAALPRSVRNALGQLEEFCSNYEDFGLDLHMGNMMQRKNGELVLTDPLSNVALLEEARTMVRRRGW